jgi:protein-S-isoprenylcysteine O-methyltransferase Ste14
MNIQEVSSCQPVLIQDQVARGPAGRKSPGRKWCRFRRRCTTVPPWQADLILQRFLPLDVPFRSITAPAGAVALAFGIALNLGGVIGVATHKTTIVPHHRVAALVTTGVYRFSRNPMYTGLAVAVAGASLVLGSWWPLILLPAAVLGVRRLVIDPEERYLTQRFGSIYDEYRKRVPRWL